MVSIYDLEIKCDSCGEVVQAEPPENRVKYILVCAVIFAAVGGAFGTAVGIATAGVGFAAWGILIPVGLYAGYKLGNWGSEKLDGPSCPECGSYFTGSGFLPF